MKKMASLFLVISFLIAGCATPVYREALKQSPAVNREIFSFSGDRVFKAASNVIYSRGFMLEKEDRDEGFILGKKYFKRGHKNIVLALQAKIVPEEADKTALYLSAVETTENLYVADRTRFFLFIIPLPGGGGKEATTIKEGEKMIEDKRFYKTLFSLIEKEVKGERA
ncbi:MAG: DUF2242 domain-containing protein [Candidatus Omnitrophica bacterium]|nr:DUF2242 domain-containing protein [Candidatus Omnitrophota bacterium]